MSNNNKVKGILKGLRFISQIFDNDEKEGEIQIGHPTDVKHVAHIGWDGHGPSENNPSWMNEFKSVPGNSSAPLNHNGDIHSKGPDNSVQRASEDSMRRGSRSVNCEGQEKDLHELPKSFKRQSNSMGNIRESHAKEKSDRPRQPKKSSKPSQPNDLCNGSKPTEQPMHRDMDSLQLQRSDLPPKKSRPKMLKDGSNGGGGSSKSRSKANSRDSNSNQEGHSRSSSKSRNKRGSFDEDGQFESGSSENVLKSYPN
ncbi:CRIB domain-containing protein RIC7 [Spatholobus suberectus]|nr:CRIB domain-containing protein RIC7 [Spatholobus suberectus]